MLALVGDALDDEGVGSGGMDAFEGGAGNDADGTCLMSAAHQNGSRAPFHLAGIGGYRSIADNATLALDGERYVLAGQTTHVAVVVGHLGHHHHEVGTVGHQRTAHVVGVESEFRAAAGGHFLGAAYYLSVPDALGHELHVLPRAVGVALLAGLPEVPKSLEYDGCMRLAVRVLYDGQRSRFPAVEGGETDAVAVGEDGDVGG